MREKRRQDREISRQDSRSDGAGRQKTNGERGREGPRKDRGLSKARESGLFNGDRDGGRRIADGWTDGCGCMGGRKGEDTKNCRIRPNVRHEEEKRLSQRHITKLRGPGDMLEEC